MRLSLMPLGFVLALLASCNGDGCPVSHEPPYEVPDGTAEQFRFEGPANALASIHIDDEQAFVDVLHGAALVSPDPRYEINCFFGPCTPTLEGLTLTFGRFDLATNRGDYRVEDLQLSFHRPAPMDQADAGGVVSVEGFLIEGSVNGKRFRAEHEAEDGLDIRVMYQGSGGEMSLTVDYSIDAVLPVPSDGSCQELSLSINGLNSFQNEPWKNIGENGLGGAGGAASE